MLDFYATQPVLAARLKESLPEGTYINAGRDEIDLLTVGQFHVELVPDSNPKNNVYLIVQSALSTKAWLIYDQKIVAEKATIEEVVAWFVEWYTDAS